MKKFKVSYSYPLEHPIKVVIEKVGLQGLVGWLVQKYGKNVTEDDLVVSERIIELPLFHQWIGKILPASEGKILEVGHVASSTAIELASLGFDVTAIDLREYPFTHPKLTSIKGDFLKERVGSQFDCIYSLSTIEHFGASERYGGEDEDESNLDVQAFRKMSELLRPDGRAIVSFPYAKKWVSGVWFRVYTRKDLDSKLRMFFNVEESRYYRRDNHKWTRVVNEDRDPDSPHDGVAMFLLTKK